jgi:hypothetical protein
MREIKIPIPEIGLIAGTRMALGVGVGLLLADRLSREQRQAAGIALVAIGGLTTFPLVADVLARRRCARAEHHHESHEQRVATPFAG